MRVIDDFDERLDLGSTGKLLLAHVSSHFQGISEEDLADALRHRAESSTAHRTKTECGNGESLQRV